MDHNFRTMFGHCLCLLFLSTSSLAIKPITPAKSQEIRLAIEGLRYHSNSSAELVAEKLAKNFARDCDSYQYNSADADLSVPAVLETFPVGAIENFLNSHPAQCPPNANVAIKVIEQKSDKPRAKKAAIRYLTAFNHFEKYQWSSVMWSMIPMLARMGPGCLKQEVEVFHHIYCGYLKKDGGAQNLSAPLEQFKKDCPNITVECR